MSSAAERKKAREAYLAALSQQRDTTTDNSDKGGALNDKNENGNNSRSVAMSKREKMFEERRKQFYDKNQDPVVAQEQGRGERAANLSKQSAVGPVQVTLGGAQIPQESQRRKFEVHEVSQEVGRGGSSLVDRQPETNSDFRNGSEVDDNAAKRAKQAEYARQLESQMNPPPHHHQQQQGGGGGYDSNPFGGSEVDDKAAKRAKQAEYARQLESQMNPPPHHHQQQQQQGGGARGGGGIQFGGSEVDDKAAKRAKQAEYARQLESQMNPPPHHHHQQQQGRGGGGYDSNPFGGSEVDDKAAKRAKQAEYARQLESQMNPQQQPPGYAGGGHHANRRAQQDEPSSSSALAEGWEMGPLGVPVRKTLAVGNRGAQKAFVQNQHSPQKPFPAAAVAGDSRQREAPMSFPEDYSHPYHPHHHQGGPLGGNFAPASALGIMDLDEREARKVQLQLENARALETQIRMKKENDERLKREEEEVERKFQEKLERERREIEIEFQKEQLKIKAEEERKESLRIQIEDKKKQKAEEELRLKELEEREDQRIRREQEVIRQREEEEMRREKGGAHHSTSSQSESSIHHVQPSPLFRPPSPIVESRQPQLVQERKRNLFSPRKESPPKLKGRPSSRQSPPPLPTPAVQESPPQHHRTRSPPLRQRRQEAETEPMNIQNHPVIERLREETALAIKEASQARKELAQLKSLVTEKKEPQPTRRISPRGNHKGRFETRARGANEVEASLDSKSVKTAFVDDWKDDESLAEPVTLKAESRFVFPDGSSYQSNDKRGQSLAVPPAVATAAPHPKQRQAPTSPLASRPKPKPFAKHKPTGGDREHHQRLANDIIKYNSQLPAETPALSPAPSPVPIPIPAPSPLPEHKPRPKSSSVLGDETARHAAQSPVLRLGEELHHRSRSSQELKRTSALPNQHHQLSGSNSSHHSAVSQLTLDSSGGGGGGAVKQRSLFAEAEAKDSEVGVDFDVDRAFRRNRRKWELLEGMAVDGTNEGLQISGEEELSLLLGGLNSVCSSRPTTSGAGDLSRPPSQQPQSHSHLGRYSHAPAAFQDHPFHAGTHSIRRSHSSSLMQSAGRAAVGESRSLSTLPLSAEDQEPPPSQELPIDYSAYGF